MATLEERFWKKVVKTDSCWEWIGGKSVGYGMILAYGRVRLAHRVSLELNEGRRPPDDLLVLHSCGNRSCVRPDHLYIGDHSNNQLDSWAAGTGKNGNVNRTNCKNGHLFDNKNTIYHYGPRGELWRKCRQCKQDYERVHGYK